MKSSTVAISILALAIGASAHGGVYNYNIDGKDYEGFHPYNEVDGQSSIQRVWLTHDPILSVDLPTVACNENGAPNPGQQAAPATAGSQIIATYNTDWTHDTGPILAYLAKCPGNSCDEVNVNELQFFKIAEQGLIEGTIASGLWGNKQMINNDRKWTVPIPASIADGAYVLRMEMIALHSMPAQQYPQCAHLSITGGGGVDVPSDYLVTFPGGYKQDDPGLTINIYNSEAQESTEYIIPGPRVYTGEAVSAPDPVPEPPTQVPEPSSPAPVNEPTSDPVPPPSSTTDAPGPEQTTWGQCAGKSWDGPSACPEDHYCGLINEWYSQCIPNDLNPEASAPQPTGPASATTTPWGQCGGRRYRGPRNCPSGAECTRINRWYSECATV